MLEQLKLKDPSLRYAYEFEEEQEADCLLRLSGKVASQTLSRILIQTP